MLCMMHQLALVFSMLLSFLGILCPMFCACVLMQRGATRRLVKAAARVAIMNTVLVYRKPPEADVNENYLRPVLRLLDSWT